MVFLKLEQLCSCRMRKLKDGLTDRKKEHPHCTSLSVALPFLDNMKKCLLTLDRASMIDRSESIQVQLGELVSLWGLCKRSTGPEITYRSVSDPKQLHHWKSHLISAWVMTSRKLHGWRLLQWPSVYSSTSQDHCRRITCSWLKGAAWREALELEVRV